MRRTGVGFLALQLVGMLVLGGCGGNAVGEIPELKEPKAANSAYRPVELGEVGKTEILLATVVPAVTVVFTKPM